MAISGSHFRLRRHEDRAQWIPTFNDADGVPQAHALFETPRANLWRFSAMQLI